MAIFVTSEVAMALDRCRKHGVRVVKAPGWKVEKVECCRGHRDSLRYAVVILGQNLTPHETDGDGEREKTHIE